jgi:hypothetical protein
MCFLFFLCFFQNGSPPNSDVGGSTNNPTSGGGSTDNKPITGETRDKDSDIKQRQKLHYFFVFNTYLCEALQRVS